LGRFSRLKNCPRNSVLVPSDNVDHGAAVIAILRGEAVVLNVAERICRNPRYAIPPSVRLFS
jgi:hypothetical protein